MSDLYQEIILEAAKNPHHQGQLPDADLILTGGNASCGDQVQLFLKFDEHDRLSDLKWQGQGCAISMAAMSLLAQQLNQAKPSRKELQALSLNNVLPLLGLDEISPGRVKCASLGVSTLAKL